MKIKRNTGRYIFYPVIFFMFGNRISVWGEVFYVTRLKENAFFECGEEFDITRPCPTVEC
jgi:hypothetical protein